MKPVPNDKTSRRGFITWTVIEDGGCEYTHATGEMNYEDAQVFRTSLLTWPVHDVELHEVIVESSTNRQTNL